MAGQGGGKARFWTAWAGGSFRLSGALGAGIFGGSRGKTALCTRGRSAAPLPEQAEATWQREEAFVIQRFNLPEGEAGATSFLPNLSLPLEEQGAASCWDQGPAGRTDHSPQFLSSSPLGQSLIPSQAGTHKPFTEHRNSPGQAVKPPDRS